MNRSLRALALSALPAILAAACSKSEGARAQPAPSAARAPAKVNTTGAAVYKERCAACHGVEGKGDGAVAASLQPKPRNQTDKTWQASVSDGDIRKIVLLGGVGVGKSPTMPGAPDLAGSPEVVDDLVKIVRAFGK